jgi:hypothetical protein
VHVGKLVVAQTDVYIMKIFKDAHAYRACIAGFFAWGNWQFSDRGGSSPNFISATVSVSWFRMCTGTLQILESCVQRGPKRRLV